MAEVLHYTHTESTEVGELPTSRGHVLHRLYRVGRKGRGKMMFPWKPTASDAVSRS